MWATILKMKKWKMGFCLRKIRNEATLPGDKTEVSHIYIQQELDKNGA
jgi:hypothetical protein